MNAKLFVADNYQWMAGYIISILILAILLIKKNLEIIALLKNQVAANKQLAAEVKEFQTEQTDALEHLNTANERKLKSQHFAHTAMRDEQRLRHNKSMELMATGHLKELLKYKTEYANGLADLKAAHKKTIEGLKGGYTYAIENQQTEHSKVSEELKQQYHLAMQERQYQFESKRMQYESFVRMIDQFDSDNVVRTDQKACAALDDFQRNYVQATKYGNKKNADTAAKVASKRLQRLSLDAQQDLTKIKEVMNTIRLTANMACLQKLDELSEIYDRFMQAFHKVMNEMIPSLLARNIEKIVENDHYLREARKAIPAIKEALIDLTRVEVRAA